MSSGKDETPYTVEFRTRTSSQGMVTALRGLDEVRQGNQTGTLHFAHSRLYLRLAGASI